MTAHAAPAPSTPKPSVRQTLLGLVRANWLLVLVWLVCSLVLFAFVGQAVAQEVTAAVPSAVPGAAPHASTGGVDPVYFIWLGAGQALANALALLVAWVQSSSKAKDGKIADLEKRLLDKDDRLDTMKERAWKAEAALGALTQTEAARSGDLPRI